MTLAPDQILPVLVALPIVLAIALFLLPARARYLPAALAVLGHAILLPPLWRATIAGSFVDHAVGGRFDGHAWQALGQNRADRGFCSGAGQVITRGRRASQQCEQQRSHNGDLRCRCPSVRFSYDHSKTSGLIGPCPVFCRTHESYTS